MAYYPQQAPSVQRIEQDRSGMDRLMAGLQALAGPDLRQFFLANPEIGMMHAQAERQKQFMTEEGIIEAEPESERSLMDRILGRGQPLISPGIMKDLQQLYPVSPEELLRQEEFKLIPIEDRAKYTTAEMRGFLAGDKEFPVEERAVAGAQVDREELRGRLAEASTAADVTEGLRGLGYPELAVASQWAQTTFDIESAQLQTEFLRDAAPAYEELSKEDRNLVAMGSVSPAFAQGVLQLRGFEHAKEMEDIRFQNQLYLQSLASMGTPQERAAMNLKLRTDLQTEVDRTIKNLREAIEKKDMTLVPSYVARLQALGNEQFLMFPEDAVLTSQTVKGLFGRVKGVEYGLTNLLETRADEIIHDAELIRSGGATEAELMEQVRAGVIPSNYAEAVINLSRMPTPGPFEETESAHQIARNSKIEDIDQMISLIDTQMEMIETLKPGEIASLAGERRLLMLARYFVTGRETGTTIPQMRGPGGR